MKKNHQTKSLNVSNARWLAYATASAASVLAAGPSAEAEIHYSGLVNFRFDSCETNVSQSFQLAGPARLAFSRNISYACTSVHDRVFVSNAPVSVAIRTAGYGFFYAKRLKFGQYVSHGRFAGGAALMVNNYDPGQFAGGGEAFVGFRFDVGNGQQYGWERGEMRKVTHKFALVDYAYADPGESITAGQTNSAGAKLPNEGSLGLFALGAAGLVAWREQGGQAIQ